MFFSRKPAGAKAHVQSNDQEKDDSEETGRPKNHQLCSISTFT